MNKPLQGDFLLRGTMLGSVYTGFLSIAYTVNNGWVQTYLVSLQLTVVENEFETYRLRMSVQCHLNHSLPTSILVSRSFSVNMALFRHG